MVMISWIKLYLIRLKKNFIWFFKESFYYNKILLIGRPRCSGKTTRIIEHCLFHDYILIVNSDFEAYRLRKIFKNLKCYSIYNAKLKLIGKK